MGSPLNYQGVSPPRGNPKQHARGGKARERKDKSYKKKVQLLVQNGRNLKKIWPRRIPPRDSSFLLIEPTSEPERILRQERDHYEGGTTKIRERKRERT